MLTLGALKLALQDLLSKREPDLHKSKAGRYFGTELQLILTEIEALPPALTGGAPLSAELDAKDAEHDGYGGAIYFATETYLRLPDADVEVVAAAKRIRQAFIPVLAELNAEYAVEADRAIERKALLKSMKADLKLFPIAGGETLADVAAKYIDAGEALHVLLSARGDVPKSSRKQATTLRPEAIGLLNQLRRELKKEIVRDAKLPRDLEHRIFGYIDTLAEMHASSPKPVKPAPVAPPETAGST